MNLDGAKLMFRLEPDERESGKTIGYCTNAIMELNRFDIPVFLECLPVEKTESGYRIKKNVFDLVQTIGIATALGDSSRNIWLKIPYCDKFNTVAKATTCPILMLGGESKGDPTGTINEFYHGLHEGNNVRGALVGRNVTFPGKDDPFAVSCAVSKIVHDLCSPDEAIDHLAKVRGKEMDALTKHF